MGYVTAYAVTDCPDHPSCALVFAAGTFCFHCGCEVLTDPAPDGLGRYTMQAPDELKAEARAAWNDSQGIRDFASSMQRAAGATPLERKAS